MTVWVLGLLVAAVVIGILLYGYNKIISAEQRAKRAYHDIDVQVNRVAQLIPNLINVVKGSAAFEKTVIERVAQAYERYLKGAGTATFDEKVKKASEFISVVYPIVLQLPQFPELKTTEQYKQLMEELRVSMDKIAYAKQFYNQAVEEFNKTILSFPWLIVARLMGKRELPYFEYERKEAVEAALESGELTKGLTE